MLLHRYEVHVVTDQEYEATRIGMLFRGGIVVDGLAGLGEDQLIVTAHVVDECRLMVQVPEGWCIKLFGGKVWATHWTHSPRAIAFAEAVDTEFEDWPEVKL